MTRALCVVPVRRGSKRVPRKNLRPLAGEPLLLHALRACQQTEHVDLVVSTDDPEVVVLCASHGIEVVDRPGDLAADDVPLDPVVLDVWRRRGGGERYWALVTVQATSPFLTSADISATLTKLRDAGTDTAVTVVDDRHIRWHIDERGEAVLETPRVNRQQLPEVFRETGAVVACTAATADTGQRFGSGVALVEMHPARSLDIDTPADFLVAEALRRQQHVVFNVTGSPTTGSGHVHRAMTLAGAMPGHEATFICGAEDELALDALHEEHFPVRVCGPSEQREEAIAELLPTVLVNDVLDTKAASVDLVRSLLPDVRIVNFEDLGSGAACADAVVNALYPGKLEATEVRSGPEWAVLRQEFITPQRAAWRDQVERVLVTFGGVDESGLTQRLLKEVLKLAQERHITLDVVLGLGFRRRSEVEQLLQSQPADCDVHISIAVRDMAARMRAADLAVTSAGRTVLECASQGLPALVLAQNERELTHSFADIDHGILNMGLGLNLPEGAIGAAFRTLVDVATLRRELFERLKSVTLTDPSVRLVPLILGDAIPPHIREFNR